MARAARARGGQSTADMADQDQAGHRSQHKAAMAIAPRQVRRCPPPAPSAPQSRPHGRIRAQRRGHSRAPAAGSRASRARTRRVSRRRQRIGAASGRQADPAQGTSDRPWARNTRRRCRAAGRQPATAATRRQAGRSADQRAEADIGGEAAQMVGQQEGADEPPPLAESGSSLGTVGADLGEDERPAHAGAMGEAAQQSRHEQDRRRAGDAPANG